MLKKLSVLLFAAFLPTALVSLDLKVEEAVAWAIEHNLSLRNSALEREAAIREYNNAWNTFLPALSLSVGLSRSDILFAEPREESTSIVPGFSSAASQTTDPTALDLGAGASLTVSPGQVSQIALAKLGREKALISYQDAKAQLERDVKTLFYLLLTRRENLVLLERNLETSRKRYEQARQSYRSGRVSEIAVLQAQVSYESQKPSYENQLIDYQNNLRNFKNLLGLDLDTEIHLSGSLEIDPVEPPSQESARQKVGSRYDISALLTSLEEAKEQKNLVILSELLPALRLAVNWSNRVSDPFSSGSWEAETWKDSYTLSLSLSVPLDGLIPGSSTDTKIKAAEDLRKRLENQLLMANRAAQLEITNLLAVLENSQKSLTALRLSADLAQRSYNMTVDAYQKGAAEQLDVEEAQNKLLEARQTILSQQYVYLSTLIDLEYALNSVLLTLTPAEPAEQSQTEAASD